MNIRTDRSLGCDPAGPACRRGDSLLTQPYDGLFEIAGRLRQRSLAIHYAGAGLLAQFFNQIRV
jgi:hypothetical protein